MSQTAAQPAERPHVAGPRARQTWKVVAAVIAAYAVGAWLNVVAFGGSDAIVLLFLPAGATLSALVLTERRQWPSILAAVAVTEFLVDVSLGWDPRWVWGLAIANTAEPLVGALLLRRYVKGKIDLLRPRHLLAFGICGVVIGPLVGSLIGTTTISLGLDTNWIELFFPFWAGDATGVLVVAGSILSWRHRDKATTAVVARWAAALLGTTAVTIFGFLPHDLPLFYLPIPLLFWMGFTQRLPVVVTSGLAMTVTATWMTNARHGPWAHLDDPLPLETATLELFLGIAVLGAWFFAIGISQRDTARTETSTERAARQRLNTIQTLTARLAQAPTSARIAEAVVRDGIALPADYGIVGIVAADGNELHTLTTGDRGSAVIDGLRRMPLDSATPLRDAVRSNTRIIAQTPDEIQALYPDHVGASQTLGIHSGLTVPISGGEGPPIGALALGFERENAIDADVIAFAEALAGVTGQALRRAQAYERELDAARKLQQALLPVLTVGHPEIRITAEYRPADRAHDVGGDWYDVFELPGGRIGLAVGDVVGHHVTAAAAMARLQSAVRILAQSAQGPAQVLMELDRATPLISNSEMTTVGYADYDPATRILRFACAGHLPPLLITDAGAEYLWDARSKPVGVQRSPRDEAQLVVPPGSTLIWFTDGLVERRRNSPRTALQHLAAEAVTLSRQDPENLCSALIQHRSGRGPIQDDIAILCVNFTHAPSAGTRLATQTAPQQPTTCEAPDDTTPSNNQIPHDDRPDGRAGRRGP